MVALLRNKKRLAARSLPCPRRRWPAAFMLICLLALGGCWDHLEVQNMLIVAGIGLDSAEKSDGLRATVELVCVEESGGETLEPVIVEGEGETVQSALQNAMSMTGGVMYGNHCKVIIIGESLARRGINDVVEHVLRSPGLRKSVEVAVAKGSSAKDILTAKTVKNEIISYELEKIISTGDKYLNDTSRTGMYRLHESQLSAYPAGVAPAVFLRDNNGKNVLCAEGLSVLSDGRLVGFLSRSQSNIYNIVTGKMKNGHLTFDEKSLSSNPISAKISKSNVRLTPGISGEALSLDIDVDATAVLESSPVLSESLSGQKAAGAIEKALGARLCAEIEALVKEAQQQYGVDIFGFYKEFEDGFRREWRSFGHDWPLRFKETEIRAHAQVYLSNAGLLK